MKVETLELANRIHKVCMTLEEHIESYLTQPGSIEIPFADYGFIIAKHREAVEKAQIQIKEELEKTLNDIIALRDGLCDETYPIIKVTFDKLTQVCEEVEEKPIKKAAPAKAISKHAPSQPAVVKKSYPTCPGGGRFGYDNGLLTACNRCRFYDVCDSKYCELEDDEEV